MGGGDAGLFWDFASLPQGIDRTEDQIQLFKIGLGAINLLYGAAADKSIVIKLTKMPLEDPTNGLNLTPYEDRGWRIFENALSTITKDQTACLDLGLVGESEWRAVMELDTGARFDKVLG